ncbi:hypothetical protein N431DRAFT_341588 [Stipitochalara longipes BDJ]|nr:hypothetical protein N431DRAFT_341588 [Stipitochalara longipes BDJ]
MPRKLPWEDDSTGTSSRPSRPSAPAPKRQKTNKKDDKTPSSKSNADGRAPSSSPPPEAAREEYMDEGKKYDDKWRMVEDEFLTVAKRFTVHLHAAEYKRQQKMVKSRNAETINTISRPVAGKMPNHTKRRMEAAARVNTQRAALDGVTVKEAEEDDDSDDGDGLPYFGTTLHGLMDTPRKRAASLAKSGAITATTRAAAGFKQAAAQSKPDRIQESPQSRVAFHTAKTNPPMEIAAESSEDDDDLDVPIPAPKFGDVVREPIVASAFQASSSTSITKTTMSFPAAKPSSISSLSTAKSSSFSVVRAKQPQAQLSPEIRSRPSRSEQARRHKAKSEKEQKDKQLLDVIPTFL